MRGRGFTLIELLAVVAGIGLLGGLLILAAASGIEKARVVKAKAELQQIEVALTLYYTDHKKYPPVRVSCNTTEREHWCELPRELTESDYLPGGRRPGVSSALEDPFNPGHTYKYAAPGPYYLNGALQGDGFAVFVPDDFPACKSAGGGYQDSDKSALASLGGLAVSFFFDWPAGASIVLVSSLIYAVSLGIRAIRSWRSGEYSGAVS